MATIGAGEFTPFLVPPHLLSTRCMMSRDWRHAEKYWAIRIGSWPEYQPYFCCRHGGSGKPEVWRSKKAAEDYKEENKIKDGVVVPVILVEAR